MSKSSFLHALLFCIISLYLSIKLEGQTVTLEYNQPIAGMEGLYFWYADALKPVALFNRNITPNSDAFAIVNGYAFLSWYKGGMTDRHLMVSRMKLGTNIWTTVELPYTNTLYTQVYNNVDYSQSPGGDSHRTISIGISAKDGTIHLVFDQHAGDLNYVVSKKNIAFADDTAFVASNFLAKRNYFKVGYPIVSCTYPNFITNQAGELVLNYRNGTSRQGDTMGLFYDGNVWSDVYTIVKGNNVAQQFFLYGGLNYYQNELYLSGSIRVYGSTTTYNQGVYIAKCTGQHGDENWLTINGTSYTIPMSNLLAPFKVAEPLTSATQDMTSPASFVMSTNKTMHFTGSVSGVGTIHFYGKNNNSEIVRSTTNAPAPVSFAAGERVFGTRTVVSTGRFVISSTDQNGSSWRDDLSFTPPNKFQNMASCVYEGKLYMVASEYKESDKHQFRFLVFDLGLPKPSGVSNALVDNDLPIVFADQSGDAFINLKSLLNTKITVFNTLGTEIYHKTNLTGVVPLNIANKGCYIVCVHDNDKLILSKKLIL
jgi:hypothetical protein